MTTPADAIGSVYGQATNNNLTHSSITNANAITNYTYHGKRQNAMKIVEEHVAFDALFDSDARFDPPKCHPQTRKALLESLDQWARSTDTQSRVMWLKDAAGAGKSAIAQTLAERWDKAKILMASFFFSRSAPRRNNKRHLFPTIVYQLSLTFPSARPHIEEAIHLDNKIFERNLQTQIEKLILEPITASCPSLFSSTTPVVIVIDGLDECCSALDHPNQDHESQQEEILRVILLLVSQDIVPVRILISSRPERQIRECFGYGQLSALTALTVLDASQNPNADIELFLRCTFQDICRRHPHLGSAWPPECVIHALVQKSSGHFIYAAVAMRYISSPRSDPDTSLSEIMGVALDAARGNPFAELDALYALILHTVSTISLPAVMLLFETMIFGSLNASARDWELFLLPIGHGSLTYLSRYLFMPVSQIYLRLIDLHSVMDIPPPADSDQVPISFIHASFSEYLTDPTRSGPFALERYQAYGNLFPYCMKHIFIQVLSPDCGMDIGYLPNGFSYLLGTHLVDTEREADSGYYTVPVDILDGIAAIVDSDEDRFARYIRMNGLDAIGLKRNNTMVSHLYSTTVDGKGAVPFVLSYLKKHNMGGFKPIVLSDVTVVDADERIDMASPLQHYYDKSTLVEPEIGAALAASCPQSSGRKRKHCGVRRWIQTKFSRKHPRDV